MNWDSNYSIRTLLPGEERGDLQLLTGLLESVGLRYEGDLDYTIGFFSGDKLIATASLSGRIIKAVAIDPAHRGENHTAKLLTYMKMNAHHRGIHSLFVYTTPESCLNFESLGFVKIGFTEEVVLLEDNGRRFRKYLEKLNIFREKEGRVASLVVNCNPFTNGHRYLIEKAAEENDHLLVFVVQEDRSEVPFEVRLELVRRGTEDLPHVSVISAGDYIISQATFPGYFLKDSGRIDEIHTRLDLEIFGTSIAAAAGITRRYVGDEPFCRVTNNYNSIMKDVLPAHGVELVVIPRLETGGVPISASEVRRRLLALDFAGAAEMVPTTTIDYFESDKGKSVIETMRGNK